VLNREGREGDQKLPPPNGCDTGGAWCPPGHARGPPRLSFHPNLTKNPQWFAGPDVYRDSSPAFFGWINFPFPGVRRKKNRGKPAPQSLTHVSRKGRTLRP